MNDDDLRRRLDALADLAPDGDELLDRMSARRRGGRPDRPSRGRRVAPLLAAVACAVLVVGVALVPSLLDRSGGRQESATSTTDGDRTVPGTDAGAAASPPNAAMSTPVPRDGARVQPTRQVGRGRIVVDVPVSWRSVQPGCDEPVVDGFFFTTGVFRACDATRPPGITTLQIDSLAATGSHPDDPLVTGSVDGVAYGESRSADGDVETAVVVVPDQDVRLTVRGPRASVDALVSSLQVLPEGRVAVPQLALGHSDGAAGYAALPTLAEMRLRLESAGLKMEVATRDGGTTERFAKVRVAPRPGTVVDAGSPVLVELVGIPAGTDKQ